MGQFILRHLWWFAVILLLPKPSEVDTFFHDGNGNALKSMLVNIEDKLDSHDYNEMISGQELKRMLVGLEEKHKALEPLKKIISRVDERLSNVEVFRHEFLETIQRSLASITVDGSSRGTPCSTDDKLEAIRQEVEGIKNKLSKKEESEKATLRETNEALESIQRSLASITRSVSSPVSPGSTDDKLETIRQAVEGIKNKLSEESLGSFWAEFANSIPHSQQIAIADEAWYTKMSEVMERQEGEILQIKRLLSNAEGLWMDLPRKVDLQELTNQTLASVETVKDTVVQSTEASRVLTGKFRELSKHLVSTNKDIQNSLTQGNTMSDQMYRDIIRGYETLRSQVQKILENIEKNIIETAKNVRYTEEAIGNRSDQILLEVGDLIKLQSSGLNSTINERFKAIETTIVEMERGAMTNLSSKIETEMSQVWRQIGNMYQQHTDSEISHDKQTESENCDNGSAITMKNIKDKENENYVNGSATTVDNTKDKSEMETGAKSNWYSESETEMSQFWQQISNMYQHTASNISLDKLTENENYVNGSATTVDNTKDKESTITSRISEVDLLGHQSLDKAGLLKVLDNIKTSSLANETQLEDSGPGPHKISSAESRS